MCPDVLEKVGYAMQSGGGNSLKIVIHEVEYFVSFKDLDRIRREAKFAAQVLQIQKR